MLLAAFRVGASRHGAAGLSSSGVPGEESDLAVTTVSLLSPKSSWAGFGAGRCLHGTGEPLERAARLLHSLKIALL